MHEIIEFREWPKIARLNRETIVTEKIDGTNAAVIIIRADTGIRAATGMLTTADGYPCHPEDAADSPEVLPGIMVENEVGAFIVAAQSRKRLITPEDDNFGFARWVRQHAQELADGLGEGYHYGEWYGSGIQRGYGLTNGEKRFMLFNVERWADDYPDCCEVATVLYRGLFDTSYINNYCIALLKDRGSQHVPGFMNPEGIVVYHKPSNSSFKVTCEKDETPKALADRG